MSMFAEVTRQVRLINDMILINMKNGKHDDETQEIKKHLNITKSWFIRISWANKKKFLLLLIGDVRYIWTFSLLLKSIWNCRPKDAVMSVCEQRVWSSYDQVPLDNDRTALPPSALNDVMMIDRKWFQTLEAEEQAWVLTELVTISGGPIMWEVMKQVQQIFEKHVEKQLENLQECEVVYEPLPDKKGSPESVKKDQSPRRNTSMSPATDSAKSGAGQVQKELDINLSLWASTVKSMKVSMKLEELEMTFKDGTKKKIWNVNRPKPEVVETVDMIQLLPSSISKRILMYIPVNQLGDCARVNKYWAYLVDEIKAELVARQKINIELEKLQEIILRHDLNLDLMSKPELSPTYDSDSKQTTKIKQQTIILKSHKPRSKFFGVTIRSPRKPPGAFKPIRNMTDCSERLEVRGAADGNIWKWCSNELKINKKSVRPKDTENNEGLLILDNSNFPCPMMSHNLNKPASPPVEPTYRVLVKNEAGISQYEELEAREMEERKRYSLWSKDFSNLYPVCKVSSHVLNEHRNN